MSPDYLDPAARFVADHPGAIARVFARHIAAENGDCAGCGTYRSTRWPCVLIHIARRAERLVPAGHLAVIVISAAEKDQRPKT